FVGLYGDLDRTGFIVAYRDISQQRWNEWLVRMSKLGYTSVERSGEEIYLRHPVSWSEFGRKYQGIEEIRATPVNGDVIVIAYVIRPVRSGTTQLSASEYAGWLRDVFWPRFRR